MLCYSPSYQVALGNYPEDHFTEEIPRKLIKDFQLELQVLSATIKARNQNLDVPYTYLDPELVENSVAIWKYHGHPSSAVWNSLIWHLQTQLWKEL